MGLLDPRPVAKKLIATAGLVLTPRDSISASTGLPARHLAAGEVVQEHVHLAARLDHLLRLVAQPLRDGVGHDAETLPVLVDEAEGILAMLDGGAGEEQPGRLPALILRRQEREALGDLLADLLFAAIVLAVLIIAHLLDDYSRLAAHVHAVVLL